MSVILTNEGQEDQITSLLGAIGSNLRVGLYTSRTGSGKAVTLSGLGDATYSGYAVQTPVFAAIADSAAGRERWQAADLTFSHNGGGTGNSITGWYLKNTATGKLHLYEDFSAPITMSASGHNIHVQTIIYYGDLTAPL